MRVKELKSIMLIAAIYLVFLLFSVFIFANIIYIDNVDGTGAVGLLFLALLVIFSFFIVLIHPEYIKINFIKKSFIILLCYFCYFIFRIVFDIYDFKKLKAYTVGTTGGIILFYGLGVLMGLLVFLIYNVPLGFKVVNKWKSCFFAVYLVCNIYLLIRSFLTMAPRIRMDIFSVAGGINYQRPGDFLIINSMMVFLLYIHNYIYLFKRSSVLKFFLLLLCFCIFMLYILAVMLFAQLLGSNNAFICCFGILFLTVIFHIFFFLFGKTKILNTHKISFKRIFIGEIGKRVRLSIFISLFIFLLLGGMFLFKSNIDLSKLRIFNYGEGGKLANFDTRLVLLGNFYTQFYISPFFGNMQADALTTGDGSYVHSFFLSMLTHTGILGTFIFMLFIISAVREYFYANRIILYDSGIAVYGILLFLGILAIAVVGVFITWIPIWFLIGFLFKPVKIIKIAVIG